MDFTSIEAAWMGGRSPQVVSGTGEGRRVAGFAGADQKPERTPQSRGPTVTIRKFFREHPSEKFTVNELEDRLGFDYVQIREAANRLVKLGELTLLKDDRKNVYGLAQ